MEKWLEQWKEGSRYQEIWIEGDGDEQALMALINGDRGWLMYLREEGDAGFSSRNPDDQGTEGQLEFLLDNGQMDDYPVAWTLPLEQVKQALDYFEHYRKPPAFITWHNDGDDGVSLNE
ncbi:MAG: hypothetical protein HFG20_02285 [Anaerotruncus sp.]|jgi:hypothetical protein|nr:hypothetical protein [Anaerotruncus sp.]